MNDNKISKAKKIGNSLYEFKFKSTTYHIEFLYHADVNGLPAFEKKWYVANVASREKYKKGKDATYKDIMKIFDVLVDTAVLYSVENGFKYCVFKSPGREIGDKVDFPNNVRTRAFIRGYKIRLNDPNCVTILQNRVAIKIN